MPFLKKAPPKSKTHPLKAKKTPPKKKKSSVNSRRTFIHVLLFHQPAINPYLQCSFKQQLTGLVSFSVKLSLVSSRVGYNETLPLNSETFPSEL